MTPQAPEVRDRAAREAFRAAARRMSLDPDDTWVGGYVDYEWRHGRHALEAAGATVSGLRVLEFGCNYGATSIVLAALGASVTGVDVNPDYVGLARLNAACYRQPQGPEFMHVPDTTRLPFDDAQFDLITCNSVLEYVPHALLGPVQREIDRVLKPGGTILVLGTSNRLWPQEVHSRRWFVTYLPRFVDALARRDIQRGVFPWQIRFGFGPSYADADLQDAGAGYLEARRKMGMSGARRALLGAAMRVLAPLRLSVGLLTPSISVRLLKHRRTA